MQPDDGHERRASVSVPTRVHDAGSASAKIAEPVQFRILGPLEVSTPTGGVAISSRRQRAVLARLLLDVGRVVSVEQFVDAIWTSAPATARTQVAICVSGLRRLLLECGLGPGALITSSPGYVLDVPLDWVDVRVMERLVARARARMSADLTEAAGLFRAALGLWRGPVLGELQGGSMAAIGKNLDERRLSITEECFDVEIELGLGPSIADDIAALVSQFPYRESLRGQLMAALYAGGRTVEALDAYRRGRELLVEELGVEPGPHLQELHRLILGGAALPGSAARNRHLTPARPQGTVPVQLPAADEMFVGRTAALATLDGLVDAQAGRAVAVIHGTGGVGKSSLALYWAHRRAEQFPDGHVFVDLHGYDGDREPVPPATALSRILGHLVEPSDYVPAGHDEQVALLRNITHDRRVLVILDNARSLAQCPLLSPPPGCTVVITTRAAPTYRADTAIKVGLEGFPPEAAMALMRTATHSGQCDDERALSRLISYCDGLPKLLRIAAAKLSARPYWSVVHLAERMADESRRLDELGYGDHDVRADLALGHTLLDAPLKTLLRRVAVADPGDLDARTAAALMGCRPIAAEEMLAQLADAHFIRFHMIDAHGHPLFKLPGLVRLFVRERVDDEEPAADLAEALSRLYASCPADPIGHRDPREVRAPVPPPDLPLVDGVLTDPEAWPWSDWSALPSLDEHRPATHQTGVGKVRRDAARPAVSRLLPHRFACPGGEK
jgi:DNA-binding SARP family transcriptional activator